MGPALRYTPSLSTRTVPLIATASHDDGRTCRYLQVSFSRTPAERRPPLLLVTQQYKRIPSPLSQQFGETERFRRPEFPHPHCRQHRPVPLNLRGGDGILHRVSRLRNVAGEVLTRCQPSSQRRSATYRQLRESRHHKRRKPRLGAHLCREKPAATVTLTIPGSRSHRGQLP